VEVKTFHINNQQSDKMRVWHQALIIKASNKNSQLLSPNTNLRPIFLETTYITLLILAITLTIMCIREILNHTLKVIKMTIDKEFNQANSKEVRIFIPAWEILLVEVALPMEIPIICKDRATNKKLPCNNNYHLIKCPFLDKE